MLSMRNLLYRKAVRHDLLYVTFRRYTACLCLSQ